MSGYNNSLVFQDTKKKKKKGFHRTGIILFQSSAKIKAQEGRTEYRRHIDDGVESTDKKTLLSALMGCSPEQDEEEYQTITICQKLQRINTEFGLIPKKEIGLKAESQHGALEVAKS